MSDDELDRAAADAERRYRSVHDYKAAWAAGTGIKRPRVEPLEMDAPAPAPVPVARWDDIDVLQRRWAIRYGSEVTLAIDAVVNAVIRHAIDPKAKHVRARRHGNKYDFVKGEFTENEVKAVVRDALKLTLRSARGYFDGLVREVLQGMAGQDRSQEWHAHRWLEYRVFPPTGDEQHTIAYRASAAFLAAKIDLAQHWQYREASEPLLSKPPPVHSWADLVRGWGDEVRRAHVEKLAEGDEATRELVGTLGDVAYDSAARVRKAFEVAIRRIETLPAAEQSPAHERMDLIEQEWHARIKESEKVWWDARKRANLPANLPSAPERRDENGSAGRSADIGGPTVIELLD